MPHVENILHNPVQDLCTTNYVHRLTAGFVKSPFKGTHSLLFAINKMYEINYVSENSRNSEIKVKDQLDAIWFV